MEVGGIPHVVKLLGGTVLCATDTNSFADKPEIQVMAAGVIRILATFEGGTQLL